MVEIKVCEPAGVRIDPTPVSPASRNLVPELRVNLGSGAAPMPGFVNVDALADAPGVDVVADIGEPLPFEDGSVQLVYASHLLEHFPTAQVPPLLADWHRILKPGGVLLVAVPDLDVIASMLVERRGWFTPPHNPWLGALYGGQKDEFDYHKTGFTMPWLAGLLQAAGFGQVRRVDRFEEITVTDASYSPLPFGINLSLNVRAVAGASDQVGSLTSPLPAERVLDLFDRVLRSGWWISTGLRGRIMRRRQRGIEMSVSNSKD